MQRILQYAGDYKKYNTVSWILSAISSLFALAPFCFIWKIICVLIEVAPDYENAKGITKYGLLALLFAALSAVIYIIALRFSYKAALRISANMRKAMLRHVASLPVNFVHDFGSGKLRKIINDTSTRAENYIGHFMPDEVGAFATSFGLVIVFLVFDWKLGILCLIPTILGIIVLVTMMGKSLVADMKRYQDSLDNMANEREESALEERT